MFIIIFRYAGCKSALASLDRTTLPPGPRSFLQPLWRTHSVPIPASGGHLCSLACGPWDFRVSRQCVTLICF